MKKILGLDLGTSSIGWAFVHEAEAENESTTIKKAGVRIVPLSNEEISEFGAGQKITLNATRTKDRGARRRLQRFKLRRKALVQIFRTNRWVGDDFQYAEQGKETTHTSLALRAKAATEKISLDELLVVLLMINKKRGYKGSPKDKLNPENGMAIDSMYLAKELAQKNLTPGQWVNDCFSSKGFGKIPQFYPSDLQAELDKVFEFQQGFYPDVLTADFIEKTKSVQPSATASIFYKDLGIEIPENKGVRSERIKQLYQLRSRALTERIELGELALIIKEIKSQIGQGSSYLAAISDRSKLLQMNNQTVGQFLHDSICRNAHNRTKGLIFSRQDYIDEFEVIWECQKTYHPQLNDEIKREIKDITIFYQRRLRSQKHLISKCEFESNRIAIPKSSPLFQLFRIWQNINAIRFTNLKTNETFVLDEDQKNYLFILLNQRDKLTQSDLKKALNYGKEFSLNFKEIQGNRTRASFLNAFTKIMEEEGHGIEMDLKKPEQFELDLKQLLKHYNLPLDFFDFPFSPNNTRESEHSIYFKMWHLIYSAEEDSYVNKWLTSTRNIKQEWIAEFMSVQLEVDYASLSSKAIKKVLPHMMDGLIYSDACALVGYNHSSSLSKEENEKRSLSDKLSEIKKNSLRNPVVEKILNQMVNVVNGIISHPELGRPDEIRIELARELKSNANQRMSMTKSIEENKKKTEAIKSLITTEYGSAYATRNNILRYILWEECGGVSVYTGETIQANKLFEADYDIDHIIPQSRLFDDSKSNKVLCERTVNIAKGNSTAYSFILDKYGADSDELSQYKARVADLHKRGKISFTKLQKLLMSEEKIPEDFVERQLRETQYITRKAMELLRSVSRDVNATSGEITARLKSDWGLDELLKQINLERYSSHPEWLEHYTNNQGKAITKIKNWSKRDDHRHHALDAIIIALTKKAYVQYLNTLNARVKKDSITYAIEAKHLRREADGKLRFNHPIKSIRTECKKTLEQILVAHKSRSKVITKHINKIKTKNGVTAVSKNQGAPRGILHLKTVFGFYKTYQVTEIKVGSGLTANLINKVANKKHRKALSKRLSEFGNDPKRAFTGTNSILKNPIFINEKNQHKIPEKVKLVDFKTNYSSRKKIDDELNIDKIIDKGIVKILNNRLKEFNGDKKKAFSNLEKNPIWLNKEKGISIKSVKVGGISNAIPLHQKRDMHGNLIIDDQGNPVPNSWVNTGNNHHVAIYRDNQGGLKEHVVSFLEAVTRKTLGMDVILRTHPEYGELILTLKGNDMFLFPADDFDPFNTDLSNPENYPQISRNLYRVQKLATKNYMFRHHCETKVSADKDIKDITIKNLRSLPSTQLIRKVKITNLGIIIDTNY